MYTEYKDNPLTGVLPASGYNKIPDPFTLVLGLIDNGTITTSNVDLLNAIRLAMQPVIYMDDVSNTGDSFILDNHLNLTTYDGIILKMKVAKSRGITPTIKIGNLPDISLNIDVPLDVGSTYTLVYDEGIFRLVPDGNLTSVDIISTLDDTTSNLNVLLGEYDDFKVNVGVSTAFSNALGILSNSTTTLAGRISDIITTNKYQDAKVDLEEMNSRVTALYEVIDNLNNGLVDGNAVIDHLYFDRVKSSNVNVVLSNINNRINDIASTLRNYVISANALNVRYLELVSLINNLIGTLPGDTEALAYELNRVNTVVNSSDFLSAYNLMVSGLILVDTVQIDGLTEVQIGELRTTTLAKLAEFNVTGDILPNVEVAIGDTNLQHQLGVNVNVVDTLRGNFVPMRNRMREIANIIAVKTGSGLSDEINAIKGRIDALALVAESSQYNMSNSQLNDMGEYIRGMTTLIQNTSTIETNHTNFSYELAELNAYETHINFAINYGGELSTIDTYNGEMQKYETYNGEIEPLINVVDTTRNVLSTSDINSLNTLVASDNLTDGDKQNLIDRLSDAKSKLNDFDTLEHYVQMEMGEGVILGDFSFITRGNYSTVVESHIRPRAASNVQPLYDSPYTRYYRELVDIPTHEGNINTDIEVMYKRTIRVDRVLIVGLNFIDDRLYVSTVSKYIHKGDILVYNRPRIVIEWLDLLRTDTGEFAYPQHVSNSELGPSKFIVIEELVMLKGTTIFQMPDIQEENWFDEDGIEQPGGYSQGPTFTYYSKVARTYSVGDVLLTEKTGNGTFDILDNTLIAFDIIEPLAIEGHGTHIVPEFDNLDFTLYHDATQVGSSVFLKHQSGVQVEWDGHQLLPLLHTKVPTLSGNRREYHCNSGLDSYAATVGNTIEFRGVASIDLNLADLGDVGTYPHIHKISWSVTDIVPTVIDDDLSFSANKLYLEYPAFKAPVLTHVSVKGDKVISDKTYDGGLKIKFLDYDMSNNNIIDGITFQGTLPGEDSLGNLTTSGSVYTITPWDNASHYPNIAVIPGTDQIVITFAETINVSNHVDYALYNTNTGNLIRFFYGNLHDSFDARGRGPGDVYLKGHTYVFEYVSVSGKESIREIGELGVVDDTLSLFIPFNKKFIVPNIGRFQTLDIPIADISNGLVVTDQPLMFPNTIPFNEIQSFGSYFHTDLNATLYSDSDPGAVQQGGLILMTTIEQNV